MDKNTVIDIIHKFRQILECKGIRASKIVLYGSFANGTYREGSDIDLVVISGDFSDKGYWERLDILSDAIYEIFEPIEAIALTPEEWEQGYFTASEFARNGDVFTGPDIGKHSE